MGSGMLGRGGILIAKQGKNIFINTLAKLLRRVLTKGGDDCQSSEEILDKEQEEPHSGKVELRHRHLKCVST